jgi:hypothetical protein
MQDRILKFVRKALSALTVSCVAIGCQTRPGPAVVPITFSEHELVDSWIGFNDRDATCYKLILKEEGKGVLYSRFEEGTGATNRISNWGMQGNVLRCEFLHDGFPTGAALLTCDVKMTLLVAKLTGVGGWKESIQFRRSAFMEKCLWEAKTLEPGGNATAGSGKR